MPDVDDEKVGDNSTDPSILGKNTVMSPTKIYGSQLAVESNPIIHEVIPEIGMEKESNVSFRVVNSAGEKIDSNLDAKPRMANSQKQARSACHVRSRDIRQCQKHFQEIIGKHKTRNMELEEREGNLRQRLEMLECSTPAVMVWNIWRMAQGAPASTVRRLIEKQFQSHDGTNNVGVTNTPSQHYDCRVREIEAERKEALRRAEEARARLVEKEAAVEERRKRLEEARRCNQEKKEKMEKLDQEVAEQRVAMKNARDGDNSSEIGECAEIGCKEKWLGGIGSASSIGSMDLECFAKLQELAEAELCMKRQINELERREEAYMRTLQQADELWSTMEGDTADNVRELQQQLDSKTIANQQLADRICRLEDELEKLRKRLIRSNEALLKFTDKEYAETGIGFDDAEATVKDRAIVAAVRSATASVTAAPVTMDMETVAHIETLDETSSAIPETREKGLNVAKKMIDKDVEMIHDTMDQGVDRPTGLGIDKGVGDEEVQVEMPQQLGSKSPTSRKPKKRASKPKETENTELDEEIPEQWKNWNWDESCPPGSVCNDMVESSTGMESSMGI